MTGTDKKSFSAPASLTVAPVKKGVKLTTPTLTLTKEATSTAGNTVLKGKCPTLGTAFVHWNPITATPTVLSTSDATVKAHKAFAAKD
jgi:hypothetical protein